MTSVTQTDADPSTAPPLSEGPDTHPSPTEPLPRKRRIWLRWLLAIVVVLSLLLLMLNVLDSTQSKGGPNDPRNLTPVGTSALAALLRNEGVSVSVSTSRTAPAVDQDTTVVLSAAPSSAQWRQVLDQRPARVIALGPWATYSPVTDLPMVRRNSAAAQVEPGCDHRLAASVGWVTVPDYRFRPTTADPALASACFGDARVGYLLLELEQDGVVVDVLAGGMQNADLGTATGEPSRGNAALGMRLFGQNSSVAWWIPADESEVSRGGTDEPPGTLPDAAALTLFALVPLIVVVAVWRGRRFGPIISERLPVVIRASETVEGHGMMYHRLKAYDTAGTHLREGTLARLASRFGTSDPAQLAGIIADRTRIPVHAVQHALSGAPPTTEVELLELKETLARIEQEARS